jgi:hypothetical protein
VQPAAQFTVFRDEYSVDVLYVGNLCEYMFDVVNEFVMPPADEQSRSLSARYPQGKWIERPPIRKEAAGWLLPVHPACRQLPA